MNQVEKDAIESKLQSSLKTSTSEYLDKFGDWFGVYRKTDENDDDYRARIIKYLLLKRGTNNAIIEAIKDYLGKDDIDVSVYEPFKNIFYTNKSHLNGEDRLMGYYYRFAVINVSIGDYFPVEIIDVINEFKPAGVTLYVTYDGASTIRGGAIIKWLDGLPKIETYQEFDRFTGYDDTFYGHINMNQSKDTDNSTSDVFKTNHSLINSLDVLTGSSSVGRKYVNYGYVTSYAYNPGTTSSVSQISNTTGRGQEVPTDYYMYTSIKNNNTVELSMQTTSGVSYLYNNFNFRDYMSKYRPQVDVQSDEARRIVSDYIKELSIDYYLSAVIPPDDSIEIKLQVYDFSINRWLTVSINNLSFYETNIGSNIGYIKDYLNSELNMFTRLEINAGRRDSVDIKVNYLDLMFYYYERGIYTIKPFKALIENYLDITRETYVEAFKLASMDNGDIISKTGYQPMGYLRLTDGYDNNINRNLLHNTTQGFYLSSKSYNRELVTEGGREAMKWSNTDNIISLKNNGETLEPGVKYTLSFYAKASEKLNIKKVYLNTANTGFLPNQMVDTQWRRYSFTFIAEEDNKGNKFMFHSYPEVNNGEKAFYLSDMKLEYGDTATAIQPNPEDIYGATDPNTRIELQAKDKDNNIIPSKSVSLYENKPGMNLLSNKDIINNTSKGSYVQGGTKELTMSLWGARITQTGSLENKLKAGKTYTISYDMEILEIPDVPAYRYVPGIIVYTRNPTKVIAETRFEKGYAQVRDLPVGAKERVEFTFTMPDVDNVELTAYTGLFNETGDASPYETREYAKVKFTDIKLEEGSTATPYTSSPEDNVSFIDKKITFKNINTKVQTIGITNDFAMSHLKLQYSYYGNDWVTLKELTDITQGETITTNNLIDVFGLQTLDYSNINPMSNVSLRSIWNVKLGEFNNKEGSLSNMPNNYFNAVWQDIDKLTDMKLSSMKIVRDTEGGVFDGSTGEIIKATLLNTDTYTDLDKLSYTLNKYIETLTLGSSRLISELKDELLTTESFNVDNRIKVVDSISEQLPNTSIIKKGFVERELAGSQYLDYGLYEPIESGTRYKLIVEGEFKDNIEFISLYNSNPNFNETFVYPTEIINGVAEKEFIAKESTEEKPRLNTDIRLYIRPYDSEISKVRRVELRKI
uniref:Virion structural protein n=1 Tax=Staphylococcus phage 184DA TaxID=3110532 RepID=A0AAU6MXG9_9CAUD